MAESSIIGALTFGEVNASMITTFLTVVLSSLTSPRVASVAETRPRVNSSCIQI